MAYLNPTIGTLKPAPLPRGRLLDLIPSTGEEVRWFNGVSWTPWPSRGLLTQDVDACNPDPSTDIDRYCVPAVDQPTFRLLDALTASALEFTPAELTTLLADRFALITSWAFASELLSGAASGGNALSKAAHAPTGMAFGAAATPVWNALAVIEADLALTLYGGAGIIHMPPSMMVIAQEYLVPDGNRWTTPSGHLVVFDGGYTNAPPPEGEAASAAGEDWIYASGPVAHALTSPKLVGSTDDAFYLEKNLYEVYMESYGLLQFDAAPVTAVLASYSQAA